MNELDALVVDQIIRKFIPFVSLLLPKSLFLAIVLPQSNSCDGVSFPIRQVNYIAAPFNFS